jgi:predicted CoA-substrate-specific enzyme activase
MVGADLVKNEITAHAVAAMQHVPDVQTIFEIGGQDSKIVMIRDGVVVDFGMNSVCAAGTGSFLEHQAERLNVKIEDFGEHALNSENPARIAGRCTVFAESDMVHKQQMGYPLDDIIYGLCQSLVRNYLNNVALGKEIRPRLVFQGGVAFNKGIIRAFNEAFDSGVYVPPHSELMGAIGAAILVREKMATNNNHNGTKFKGFGVSEIEFKTSSFICKACPNLCEVSQISAEDKVLARWGGRCDMWERVAEN